MPRLSIRIMNILLPVAAICLGTIRMAAHPDPGTRDALVWMMPGSTTIGLTAILAPVLGEDPDIRVLGFDLYRIRGPEAAMEQVRAILKQSPDVRFAGGNPVATLRNTVPDDPAYPQQGFHRLIGSEFAWDISTGGLSPGGYPIVVAVMDAGFDPGHEDIQPNLWVNPGEIPGDGIDNDGNGYTDDFNSYNPRTNDGAIPVHHHGHSVSGYIGARGDNGLGVAGINWITRLMLVAPATYADDFIAGFRFLYDWRRRFNDSHGQSGAYIVAVNLSLGFDESFPSDLPWMCPLIDSLGSVGIVVVGAAPNAGVDIGTVGDMPCLCGTAEQICVTNTTEDDDLVSNAGFSSTFVHLSAPGYNSYTVKLASQGSYGTFSGTSAATPMVTGALALLASMPCSPLESMIFDDPSGAAQLLRKALLDGAEPLDILSDITTTGGRLCLSKSEGGGAVDVLSDLCGSPEGDLAILSARPVPVNDELTLSFRSRGSETFPLRIYNMVGQQVYGKMIETVAFSEKMEVISTTFLTPGAYVVVIGSGKRTDAVRILVHH